MLTTYQRWHFLQTKWCQRFPNSTVKFTVECESNEPFFVIKEYSKLSNTLLFHFTRSSITLNRSTKTNILSLLGVSLITNFDCVIITEGVSDYFAVKLLCPNLQVLGVTNLKGSPLARKFLSLFKRIIIIADNDSAGLSTLNYYRSIFPNNKFYIPVNKDVSEDIFSPLHTSVKSKLTTWYQTSQPNIVLKPSQK